MTRTNVGMLDRSLRSVFAGIAPVMLGVQAVSFLSSVALARVLGATYQTDAYYLALSIPLVVEGVLMAAVRLGAIPALTQANTEEPERFDDRASELVSGVAVGAAALAVPISLLTMAILPTLAGGSPERTVDLARNVIAELCVFPVFGAVTGVLGAVLTVRGRYIAPIAVMVFEPAIKILLILTVAGSLGAYALALGNVAGSLLAAGTLYLYARREGLSLRFTSPHRSPLLRSVAYVSAPLLVAQAVLQFNPPVDRLMSAALGVGSITVLELGLRLFNAPLALLGSTLIAPIVAIWSARYASDGWPAVRSSVLRALRVVLLALPPVVIAGFVFRGPLVEFIYSGGQYTPEDVARTADIFGYFMLSLPAQLLVIMLASVFVVRKHTVFPMMVAIANVCLNLLLDWVLRSPLGINGIALSTTLTVSMLCVCYFVGVDRLFGSLELRLLAGTARRVGAAAAAASAAAWLVQAALVGTGTRTSEAVLLVAGALCVLGAYFGVLLLLGERVDLPRLVGRWRREASAPAAPTPGA